MFKPVYHDAAVISAGWIEWHCLDTPHFFRDPNFDALIIRRKTNVVCVHPKSLADFNGLPLANPPIVILQIFLQPIVHNLFCRFIIQFNSQSIVYCFHILLMHTIIMAL